MKKIDEYGTICYYNKKGKFHRINGPAIERRDGYKSWCVNGKNHREDGPAVEHANGDKSWWLNGKLHRENGYSVDWHSRKSFFLYNMECTKEEFLYLTKYKENYKYSL